MGGVVDAFPSNSFSSGGVYYAMNNGKLSASTGVSLGRALTDSLLLLENLAQQNEEAKSSVAVMGSPKRRLLRVKQTTSSGQGNGHWAIWNSHTFQTKDAFRTTNNRNWYFNEEGIFFVAASWAVVGSASRNNWMYLYRNGDLILRTCEGSGSSWWHLLRVDSILRFKENEYVGMKVYWSSSTQAHNLGDSQMHLIEVSPEYNDVE